MGTPRRKKKRETLISVSPKLITGNVGTHGWQLEIPDCKGPWSLARNQRNSGLGVLKRRDSESTARLSWPALAQPKLERLTTTVTVILTSCSKLSLNNLKEKEKENNFEICKLHLLPSVDLSTAYMSY